eukprot:COSAG06_NODE_46124_length_349_cov_0.820000_1_plen_31_part_01
MPLLRVELASTRAIVVAYMLCRVAPRRGSQM